jgi:hypothetical protein
MPKIAFNEPPAPPVIHIEPAAPVSTDDLTALVDTEALDPEGDDVSYHWTWYADDVEALTGTPTVEDSRTLKGQVWKVVVTATDGEFESEEATASVTIGNAAPVMDAVSISPASPTTSDDLTLDAHASDPDGDTVTYGIVWTKDGTEQAQYANDFTIPADATGSLEDWTATVTPADGTVAGETQSASVYVDNTTPHLGSIRVVPTAPTVTDSVYASVVDLDDPDQPEQTVSVEFVWHVNGVEVFRETVTDGNSYLVGGFAKGDDITVSATPSDGYTTGNTVNSETITAVDTPPVLDGVTLSPSSGYESSTFTCETGTATDPDGDTISYGYRWYVNGSAIAATTDSITGSYFSKNNEIYCVVTPYDGEADGTSVTSDTVTVLDSPPSITGVSISPGSPTVQSNLTASVSGASDADGDSISYTYAWTVNGAAIHGSSSTLSSSNFVRDDDIAVTVTPSDGTESGHAITSSTVTVGNAAPTLSSVYVTPSPAYTDDNLTANASGGSDADGDDITFTYQWYRNGIALSGATSASLSSSYTTKGDRLYCAVTPYDGFDYGTAHNSSFTTINNSAPEALADATTGLTANECDVIELDASGSSDADGDTLSYTWSLTSKPTGSLASSSDIATTTSESPTFRVDYAGNYTFSLSANDGSTSASDTVTITVYDAASNATPVPVPDSDYTTLTQTTGCSSAGSGYVCTPCSGTFNIDATASYDDDGDPLHYAWSTASGYATIASATSESTTVQMRGMPTTHLTTTSYQATLTLRVQDCAGNAATEDLVLTFECTGN